MLNAKTRLKAATLPMVLVISVLILLVVLFVYSLWDMNFLYYSSFHYKKQQQENLNSAIVLYSNDSTFLKDYDEEKIFRLYETDSASTVSCITQQWGCFFAQRELFHDKVIGQKTGMRSPCCPLAMRQKQGIDPFRRYGDPG